MKVWHVRPEQAIIPTLLPWISESMEESTYLRCPEDEGTVLLVNLPTCGVVPSMKRNYFITLITGLMASMPTNGVAIVIHANRAACKSSSP